MQQSWEEEIDLLEAGSASGSIVFRAGKRKWEQGIKLKNVSGGRDHLWKREISVEAPERLLVTGGCVSRKPFF